MTAWVLLLRGINVGGHNKLPMADLRAILERLGAVDVATYIQSGNAVFAGEGAAQDWRDKIQAAILEAFGFSPDVFVLPRSVFIDALDANPFHGSLVDPKTLHLCFLKEPVALDVLDRLTAAATQQEELCVLDNVLYFFTPNGFGRSDLAGKLGRLLKTPMTARNLRSCYKIKDLAVKL